MTSNDRDGTTVHRLHEETGKPTTQDETFYPPAPASTSSQRITDGAGAGTDAGSDRVRRIEDVTDTDTDADAEQQSRDT